MARARTRKKIDTTGKPWARYLRLSKAEAVHDRSLTKEQRIALTIAKLNEHNAELTRWMDVNSIPYGDDLVFMDPGLSAWKPDVQRPEWDRMMVLAEAGEIAGIGIVAVDRFTRDVTTMEDLIKLAECTNVKIGGPRAGRLDLTTYDGIQQARGAAMQAANESLATSFRIKERLGQKLRAGQPMGTRAFGFETNGRDQRPEEVKIIRELAARMIAGEPLSSLAEWLNDQGVTTARGKCWQGGHHVGRMLGNVRYGGYVVHHGEIVGKIKNRDGSVQEPVLDQETYGLVQALLASRRRGRRPTGEFWLTGVIACADCERTMSGAHVHRDGNKSRIYQCHRGIGGCGKTIDAEIAEAKASEHMIRLLSDPQEKKAILEKSAALNDARAEQQTKLDAIEKKITKLTEKWSNDEIGDAAYDGNLSTLNRRMKMLQAALNDLEPEAAMIGFDPAADWRDAEMTGDEKRQEIRRYRVQIKMHPDRGVNRFDPDRVQVHS